MQKGQAWIKLCDGNPSLHITIKRFIILRSNLNVNAFNIDLFVFETDESDSKMMLAKNVQLIYLSENKFFLPKGLFCFLLDVVVVVAAAAVVVVAVVVVDCNESKQK